MKKKIVYGIAVLAIAAVAVINVSLSSQQNNELSDLSLANIEALAQEPGDGQYACYANKDYVCCCNLYARGYYCPCGW
jgi:hypothetical protein